MALALFSSGKGHTCHLSLLLRIINVNKGFPAHDMLVRI